MKKYWLTSPRFMRQAGESHPRYVAASIHIPVLVELDDDVVVSESDVHLRLTKPDKPAPHHAGRARPKVAKAQDRDTKKTPKADTPKKADKPTVESKSVRAADR